MPLDSEGKVHFTTTLFALIRFAMDQSKTNCGGEGLTITFTFWWTLTMTLLALIRFAKDQFVQN